MGKVKVTTMTRTEGFTLIELMITLAVAAILAALAAPGFSSLIRDHRLSTQANTFLASLQLARTEAVKRGVQVTIRRNGGADAPWDTGWRVFTDWDGDGEFDGDVDQTDCTQEQDCILKQQAALDNGMTMRTGGIFSTWMAYQPTGFPVGSGDSNIERFRLCDSEANTAFSREIVIISTGRAVINEVAGECP